MRRVKDGAPRFLEALAKGQGLKPFKFLISFRGLKTPQTADKVIVQLKAFPRRLKPCWFDSLYGAAEAAPFQNGEFVIDLRGLKTPCSSRLFRVDWVSSFSAGILWSRIGGNLRVWG